MIAQTNDLESIKQMIINGMGISILSGLSVKNLLQQGLVLSYPLPEQFTRKFYLVYLKSRTLSSSLQEFIRHTLHFYERQE